MAMSELPDHDHVREIRSRIADLQRQSERLDDVQRESEMLRERIAAIQRESPEYPRRGEVTGFLDSGLSQRKSA